jgi:hypothetical protein
MEAQHEDNAINEQQQIEDINQQGFKHKSELIQACEEFAQLFSLQQIQSEGIKPIEDNVEGVLTRLDEFGEQLDYIHSNTTTVSNTMLPQLLLVASNLQYLYKKIDIIHEYVHSVQTKVESLDEKVKEIEDLDKEPTSIQKFIPKFLMRKSSATSSNTKTVSFNAMHYKIDASQLTTNIKQLEDRMNETRKNSGIPSPVRKQQEAVEQNILMLSDDNDIEQPATSQESETKSDQVIQQEEENIEKEETVEENNEEEGEEEEGEEEEGEEEEGEDSEDEE